jgi:TetR/AcrR family transcriptional regulator
MTETTTRSRKKGDRRIEILRAIVLLLQKSNRKRITTKTLASELNLSEAALYRHFASKGQMFSALLDNAESTILSYVNAIETQEKDGLVQANSIAKALILLPQEHPGIVSLLVGDFLASEDASLQEKILLIFNKIRTHLKQALKVALMQGGLSDSFDIEMRVDMLLSLIIGQWTEFCKCGRFKDAALLSREIDFLLS